MPKSSRITRTGEPPGKATTARARALARSIKEGLELLEKRYPISAEGQHVVAAPLPSLLQRCEAAVAAIAERPPLRAVLGFTQTDALIGANLLSLVPNTAMLHWRSPFGMTPSLAEPSSCFMQRPEPDLRADATATAFEAIENKQRLRGQDVIYRIAGKSHHPAESANVLIERLAQQRPACMAIAACHPLHAWLDARQGGQLGPRPMRLEDFSEAYLDFLDQHTALLIITARDIAADPSAALARFSAALRLRPDEDAGAYAGGFDIDNLWPVRQPGDAILLDANAAPATDEPLDTPAYSELCARLGFDPAQLQPVPAPCTPTLARRPITDSIAHPHVSRTPARIMNILPRIARSGAFLQTASPTLSDAELVRLIEESIAHPRGFYEKLDELLAGLSPADGALLLIGCAAHFAAVGQPNDCLSLLAEARDTMPAGVRELQLLAADLYLRLNKPELAVDALTYDARHGDSRLASPRREALQKKLEESFATKASEHGHALLIEHIAAHPPAPLPRRRVLIEIGTTRELLPGQGSTEKLARICADWDIDFITVDMDPRNSRHARRMFRRLNLPGRAITAKGEDFLAEWQGPIDYCFLDAYDFDHGKHSELRQTRYETYLGGRISELECHAMHLACAQALVTKLSPDGVICIDDTWLDDKGAWTAKGTTAMPFLLKAGLLVRAGSKRSVLITNNL